jgi:NTP pyrophosphatase (non-canonical NTP hydrolase)
MKISELPPDVRAKAEKHRELNIMAGGLGTDDLMHAFHWGNSPEGFGYWFNWNAAPSALATIPIPTLNTLAQGIYEGNKSRGFWSKDHQSGDRSRNFGELLMLITSELGEALEAHRKDRWADIRAYRENGIFKDAIKDTVEDEIADAVIRLLDLCAGYGIDLDFHLNEKLKYNATRPYLHNKAY